MKGRLALAGVALAALAGGLTACGTHDADGKGQAAAPPKSSAAASTTPPASGSSTVVTVEINASTAAKPVHLQVGQQLRIRVSPDVAIGAGADRGARPCPQAQSAPGGGRVLKQLCEPGNNEVYQAIHPGTVTMLFSVRPKCTAGEVCPDWIRALRLPVTVTKA